MATEYNIQMHEYNGTDYDDLFPKTHAKFTMLSDSAAEQLGVSNVESALLQGGGGAGSLCTITFDAAFAGQSFTVSQTNPSGSWTKNGTVPTVSPYVVEISLPYTSTTYTISCALDGTTYSSTVTTGAYYGSCTAEIRQATLNLVFGTGLSGTYTVRKTDASGEVVTTGTATAGGTVVLGVAPATYYTEITMNNLKWSGTASPTASTAGTITFNTCAINVSIDSGVAGQSYTLKNSTSTTVASGNASTSSFTVYVPRTADTYTLTTTASSNYGGATFIGTASVTTSAESVTLSVVKATLTITYASDFAGRSTTISGTNVSITKSVPSSSPYQVVVYMPTTSGSTTITSTTSDGTSFSTSVTISSATTYTATLNSIDAVLNNNSFAVIKTVSDAGNGASYWSVGDRKGVTFTSGTIGNGTETKTISGTWYMSVLGFNHNNEGGIHFQFGWTALTGGVQIAFTSWTADQSYGAGSGNGLVMNSTNTNVGGWPNSLMRGTELGQNKSSPSSGSFMYLLPSDLRNVMRSVTKTTNTGNSGGSNTETSTDYLWLPSEVEVFGSATYSGTTTGQAQYDYYKGVSAGSASKNAFAAAGKVRYGHDRTSRAVYWWERSPRSSNTASFCLVDYYGSADLSGAYDSYGIAPCLCI